MSRNKDICLEIFHLGQETFEDEDPLVWEIKKEGIRILTGW